MYKNFIEMISDNENLVDIANLGNATQSSLSKWSKTNDAQRSINGNGINHGFAFHTDKEKNPWWNLDFKIPVRLNYIIINNRKREEYQWIASSIRVVITNETGEEITIHQGKLFFGSLPDSLPLILPLNINFLVRRVRIQLEGFNYLHLSDIYCLSKKSLQQIKGKPIYFSIRQDGLGERLRALLNAKKIARINDGYFYFAWEDNTLDFHSVDNVQKTFSQDYIDKHYKDLKQIKSLHTIDISETKNISKEYLSLYDGIVVGQGSQPFKYDFDSIGFSEENKIAIKKAFNVTISENTVAIHLRAGDIVYGIYRFNNSFYYKVIPVYVLDMLIKDLQRSGKGVLIFGQDIEFCRHIVEKYNILFSIDTMDKEFNENQAAIFDIVLMSRCNEIFAKLSGFAILSSLIGDSGNLKDYKAMFTQAEIISAFDESILEDGILNDLGVGGNPLLKAFSISHFIDSYQEVLPLEYKIKLIKQSIELDAQNFYYKLLYSIFLYELGENNQADIFLMEAIKNDNGYYGLDWIARRKNWLGSTVLDQYIKPLEIAKGKGSIVASIPILLHEYYAGTVDFELYIKIASDEAKLGSAILRKRIDKLNN